MLQDPPSVCPVCQKEADFKFIQDHQNKDGKFSLFECSRCKVQFWMPFKNPGAEWYSRHYDIERRDRISPKVFRNYHKRFLRLHRTFPRDTRLLDLGCGSGEFIAELQKRGCEVWGVDFDEGAISFAKRHFGLKNLYVMSFDEFFQLPNLPQFDVITFFEVIEHLDNPLEFIENVKKILRPGGKITLSVPSRGRMLANLSRWDFPYNHLSRWNKEAIVNLFREINFKISSVDYVDQFDFLLGIFVDRFRWRMVAKTANTLRHDNKPLAGTKRFLVKIVHFGAYLKDYIIGGLPAGFLWLIGKMTNRKNGDMLIELKPQRRYLNQRS